MITDKRLFVKKGLQGRLDIIDFRDIAAYQHIMQNIRGITSNFIHIYLKSGERISSGSLYIKEDNVLELLSTLNAKIGCIVTSRKQYKVLKLNWCTYCCVDRKRNYLFPMISFSPFIIALIMLLLYVGGVNEMGKQMNIQVTGTVIEKSIDYDDRQKTSSYDFTILEDEINNKYDVSVTEEIYSMFAESDKIMIKAKKGSLGIVYDKWFYTQ